LTDINIQKLCIPWRTAEIPAFADDLFQVIAVSDPEMVEIGK
jgi:hypothetical protein